MFWRCLAAAGSGVLCGLAVLYDALAWLAWAAPSVWLALLWRGRACLRLTACFAVCYYLVSMCGMLGVAQHIRLPMYQAVPVILLLMVAVASYLSLYPVAAAALYRWLGPVGWSAVAYWPLAWFVAESLQGRLFGGFPGLCLGISQGGWPPVLQSAALWGASGLSALIILVNALLAAFWQMRRMRFLLLAGLVAGGNLLFGWYVLEQSLSDGAVLRVAAAHTDINVSERWSGASDDDIFADYAVQAVQAAHDGARLVLLPETAMPYAMRHNAGYGAAWLALADKLDVTLLPGGFADAEGGRYNSLFAAYDGRLQRIYDKQALVPFGEYVPARGLLGLLPEGFWQSFPVRDLQPGIEQGAVDVPYPGGTVRAGAMICYDVCFTDIAGRAVRDGAELLLAASNDTWYVGTRLRYQHLAHSVLRAVEYRRAVLNSTNGGISALIDGYGRIIAQADGGAAVGDIRLCRDITPYARWGGLYIWPACGLLVLLGVGVRGRVRPGSGAKLIK